MVLSNAERQRRFRQRLAAKVRGDDLGARVREVIDAALRVAWRLGKVPDSGDFDEWETFEAFVAEIVTDKFQKNNGTTVAFIRSLLQSYHADATGEDQRALARALDVPNAVSLRHE